MRQRNGSPMLAALAAVALMMSAACTDNVGGQVYGDGEALNMSSTALSAGDIDYLSGFYSNCQHRDNGARWSIPIGGAEAPLPSLSLAVVHGDSTCELHLDQVVVSGATHLPAAVMQLGENYAAASTAFSLNGDGETSFYANAQLAPDASFTADFTVRFAYSADLSGMDTVVDSNVDVQKGVFEDGAVPAPNYTANHVDSLFIAVDENNYITIATGAIEFDGATTGGQKYVVWDHDEPAGSLDSFAAVDALFKQASLAKVAITEANFDVSAEALTLLNERMRYPGIKRSVIIQNLVEDVPSYQFFTYTFTEDEVVAQVTTSEEFTSALADPEVTIINITANLVGEFVVTHDLLTIKGNNKTITGYLTISADDVTVENLSIIHASPGGVLTINGERARLFNVDVQVKIEGQGSIAEHRDLRFYNGFLNVSTLTWYVDFASAKAAALAGETILGALTDGSSYEVTEILGSTWKVASVHGVMQFAISQDSTEIEFFPQPNGDDNYWYWHENNGADANMLSTYTSATGLANTQMGGENQNLVAPRFGKDANPVRAGGKTYALASVPPGTRLDEIKLEYTEEDPVSGFGPTVNFWITDGQGHYGIFAPTSGGMGAVAQTKVNGDGTRTVTLNLGRSSIPDTVTVAVYEHNGLTNVYGDPYTTMTWGGENGIKHLTIAGSHDYQRAPTHGWEAWGDMFMPLNTDQVEVLNYYGIGLAWGDTVGGQKRWNTEWLKIRNVKIAVGGLLYEGVFESAQRVPAVEWDAFVVRAASVAPNAEPAINEVTVGEVPALEFLITAAGMKAAWGTNSLNGFTIADLGRILIERLDDTTRFTGGSGPAVGPYMNFWVTDGAGRYAVIANEPSNPEWNHATGEQWDITGAGLLAKSMKVYETPGWNTNTSWVHTHCGTSPLTFDCAKTLRIEAPSAAYILDPANGVGTGAPRVLGTDFAYGFNWVFGDTQSNYQVGQDGYIVANPTLTLAP